MEGFCSQVALKFLRDRALMTLSRCLSPGWQRSFDSPRMRIWLAGYLRQPGSLPLTLGLTMHVSRSLSRVGLSGC